MPAEADDWIRLFIKHLELHFLDSSRELPPNAGVSEFRTATVQAIVATFHDSGMELESIAELLGQAVVNRRPAGTAWSDAVNQ